MRDSLTRVLESLRLTDNQESNQLTVGVSLTRFQKLINALSQKQYKNT